VDYEASLVGALAETAMSHGVRLSNASVGGHYLANQYELVHWLRVRNGLRGTRFVLLLTPFLIGTAGRVNTPTVGADGRLYGSVPGVRQLATVWVKTHTVLYARLRDALRAVGIRPGDDGSASAVGLYAARERATGEARLTESIRAFMKAEGLTDREVDVVYTPLAAEFGFEPLRQAAAAKGMEVDRDGPFRRAAAAASALGLRFVDLRPTLAVLKSGGIPLSLTGDPHYSAQASRASASAIWAALEAALTKP